MSILSKIVESALLEHLYNRLPQVYRDMDVGLRNTPFRRYLSALVEGGYSKQLKEINDFGTLVDPLTCPKEFLPYFCESFNLKYSYTLSADSQRKVLANIGEIMHRVGTYSCLRFILRTLMNWKNTHFDYERDPILNGEMKKGRYLDVHIELEEEYDYSSLESYTQLVGLTNEVLRYLSQFIPYYIDLVGYLTKVTALNLSTNYRVVLMSSRVLGIGYNTKAFITKLPTQDVNVGMGQYKHRKVEIK